MGWPGPVTHRQYLAWIEWFAIRNEEMGLTPGGQPGTPTPRQPARPEREYTAAEASAFAKARWVKMLGGGKAVRQRWRWKDGSVHDTPEPGEATSEG